MTSTADTPATDLTVREVADALGTSPKFVYTLINCGDLAAIRYGQRFIRITRAALDEFRDSHTTPAAKRAQLLGEETVRAVAESAAEAPPLTEEQRDTIRSAFRAPPKMPRPNPRPKRGRNGTS